MTGASQLARRAALPGRTPRAGLGSRQGVRQRRALGAAQPGRAGRPGRRVHHVPDPSDARARCWTGSPSRAPPTTPGPAVTVSSTVVTVIALVLGLTVVALQLSSTQFSPRLLRNFLRDRAPRWCSASSSPPSSTARPGCSPSASHPGSGPRSSPGSRSAAPSCCCSPAWAWSSSSPTTWSTRSRSTRSTGGSSRTPGGRSPACSPRTRSASRPPGPRSGRCR